ncbi:MAG: TetR/AcrR family transcriptional regulator [Akkermansiaceae bacterium]|nr:TetR/AcrR family transcriptional regulator [Armatimonadota bacterium]
MSKVFDKSSIPPSLRERQRSEREESILTVALAMMGESGYAAMTMDDLAAGANISKPTLYTYFASKEEVAVRAVVRTLEHGGEFVDSLSADLPAWDRIEAALRYMFEGKFVHRLTHFCTVRDALGPTIRAHPEYRNEYERLLGRLIVLFDEAKRDGTFKPELETRIAVQTMFSFLRDTEYIDLIERGESGANGVVDTLITILLDGFRVKETR